MNTVKNVIPNDVVYLYIRATLIITLACFIYLLLDHLSLKHSSALFIGIPYMMSILLAAKHPNKDMTQHVLLMLALGLFASFILLNEGSFCVPMTAPIFLVVGLYVTICIKKIRLNNKFRALYIIALFTPLILSFEGTNNKFELNRDNSTAVTITTNLSSAEILRKLSTDRQITDLPLILRFGFPKPTALSGSGTDLGNLREVYFTGGEGQPGNAVFKISSKDMNSITFDLINDDSHISHWLEWNSSTVSWKEVSSGETLITWSIDYTRKLDPAWYFSPLQELAVKAAAETLLNNLIIYK